MADSGLLIGWDRVAPGQDVRAVELWAEMQLYLKRLHAEGTIDHFQPVILGAHGGRLNGFVLVHASQDRLDHLRNSQDFLLLNVRANKALVGFTVVRAHVGEEAAKILRLFATT